MKKYFLYIYCLLYKLNKNEEYLFVILIQTSMPFLIYSEFIMNWPKINYIFFSIDKHTCLEMLLISF